MASLMEKLYEASYNGVTFLSPGGEMTQGRKTVTHEYPNQTYRFVEDLGKNLRTFNIKAIISGTNYFVHRTLLIEALNLGGIGVLVHPFYGVTTAVCKNYSINEDITSLGECQFNITFEEAFPNIFPLSLGSTVSTLVNLTGSATDLIKGDIFNKFNISTINNSSYSSSPLFTGLISNSPLTTYGSQRITTVFAANQCAQLYESFNQVIEPSNISNDALNIFKDKNNYFYTNRFNLIRNPSLLSSTMADLFSAFDDIALNSEYGYMINSSIYGFGENQIYPKPTTQDRIERIQNTKIIDSSINAFLLLNLYNNAVLINYLNNNQLTQTFDDLERKYQFLISNNNLSNDTLLLLKKIRVTANNILKSIYVNIDKVVNVQLQTDTPLSVLLYNYYENFNNESQIISLNNIFDSTVIDGTINMLST